MQEFSILKWVSFSNNNYWVKINDLKEGKINFVTLYVPINIRE